MTHWLNHFWPVLVLDLLFALLGGYRWLKNGKHFGPAHRWILLVVGLTTLQLAFSH